MRIIRGLAALLVLLTTPSAHGHNPLRPDLNSWFDHLQNADKSLCCSFADGQTVADPDWETLDGHYRVRLNGQWIEVPDSAIITQPNLDGRTIVWPSNGGAGVRCFMPGAMI